MNESKEDTLKAIVRTVWTWQADYIRKTIPNPFNIKK